MKPTETICYRCRIERVTESFKDPYTGAFRDFCRECINEVSPKVRVDIVGGAADLVIKSRGITVEIRDYDTDSSTDDELKNAEVDEAGNYYFVTMYYQSEEIK